MDVISTATIKPFSLRMPTELKEVVKKQAKSNGRSLNSEILVILRNSVVRERGNE
ncbi:Arc family DNA-binding protein [Grimontia marina]|uniref:Arc-like DNA binding domain protein n=1 Tax=Grimontia marina TaxID=646534 RepID=A0A128EZQ6_9GAMM|nr:Arc family DNA-binding protein [Grimontia marina]CZF79634.1 Arc-like DNA binding domain protein [Grimontia marina]